jgi:hypothetical protein
MHEILESYGGAINGKGYLNAHDYSMGILPLPKLFMTIDSRDLFNVRYGIQVGDKQKDLYTVKVNPFKK